MDVQLFTRAGSMVGTVKVEPTPDGKWPAIVSFRNKTYALQNGRYVEAEIASAAEVEVA